MTTPRSVWDFPRPPIVEAEPRMAVVEVGAIEVARSSRALRVLETSHPPTIYLPAGDVRTDLLTPNETTSVCEFKGRALYFDLSIDGARRRDVAWMYPDPADGFEDLRGRLSFYPSRVDRCTLGGEAVEAQNGDFYGGWITPDVIGPFKGGPGTLGW